MGAINDVFAKQVSEIKLGDVQNLIDEQREETRYLEYKDPAILNEHGKLSEWVSAFLNADGGLIILGVCESDTTEKEKINSHVKIFPTKIKFVSNTKEQIEQLVFGNIRCSSKPKIEIYPIRNPDNFEQAVFLIEIPQGDNPPYQAHNNKYYRRLNVTKYDMPHSEIADFFGKRRNPKLRVKCVVLDPKTFPDKLLVDVEKKGGAGLIEFRRNYRLRIFVGNEGHASAKHALVSINFTNMEIVKVISGPEHRLDRLRKMPSLQWNGEGIVYADFEGLVIWDLIVKLHKGEQNKKPIGEICWQAYAEEMDKQEGKYDLTGLEFGKLGRKTGEYFLQTFDEMFGAQKSKSSKDVQES